MAKVVLRFFWPYTAQFQEEVRLDLPDQDLTLKKVKKALEMLYPEANHHLRHACFYANGMVLSDGSHLQELTGEGIIEISVFPPLAGG